ncbi:MAG: hypothetical protein WC822_04625 [Candidatus Paceibacterota bacterium]|jgi:hypothetical protein
MNFKKVGIVLFLIFSFFPVQNILAQVSNTGFVSGNIWYSKDPFEEGDKIKIYTFLFNPDVRELSGTVNFFDNTTLLGKREFKIPAKGADDISIDWTVTAGDHTIFGKIENAKFLISKGKYEEINLSLNETEKSSRIVSKKIVPKSTGTEINTITNSITQPLTSTIDRIEELREDTKVLSENKKEEVKKEIKALDDTHLENLPSNKNSTIKTTNPILKPFKYVELLFLSISSLILNNKILFYGIFAIIIFFILRYIWNIVF